MSFVLNQGPSFDLQMRPQKMGFSGFQNRFELPQDSPLMTPGKKEPHLKSETMKGTTRSKKPTRKPKGNPRCKDAIPTGNPEPIYGGFSNIKSKASTKVSRKKMPKLKKPKTK